MGLIKVILIILLVYYALKIFTRFFAPILLKYVAKKTEKRFQDQFGGFGNQRQPQQQQEGEVTIDKAPQQKTSNKNVGDYVDFEELE